MLLMRAASITWASERGLDPGNLFWAPNGTRLSARYHFTGPKKVSISRAQLALVMDAARIKSIAHGAYQGAQIAILPTTLKSKTLTRGIPVSRPDPWIWRTSARWRPLPGRRGVPSQSWPPSWSTWRTAGWTGPAQQFLVYICVNTDFTYFTKKYECCRVDERINRWDRECCSTWMR